MLVSKSLSLCKTANIKTQINSVTRKGSSFKFCYFVYGNKLETCFFLHILTSEVMTYHGLRVILFIFLTLTFVAVVNV